MNHQTHRRPRGWLVACAGIAVLLAGCGNPYSRPPGTYGAPPPGRAGTAPAISNMAACRPARSTSRGPGRPSCSAASRRVDSGVYEVELTSGSAMAAARSARSTATARCSAWATTGGVGA